MTWYLASFSTLPLNCANVVPKPGKRSVRLHKETAMQMKFKKYMSGEATSKQKFSSSTNWYFPFRYTFDWEVSYTAKCILCNVHLYLNEQKECTMAGFSIKNAYISVWLQIEFSEERGLSSLSLIWCVHKHSDDCKVLTQFVHTLSHLSQLWWTLNSHWQPSAK